MLQKIRHNFASWIAVRTAHGMDFDAPEASNKRKREEAFSSLDAENVMGLVDKLFSTKFM